MSCIYSLQKTSSSRGWIRVQIRATIERRYDICDRITVRFSHTYRTTDLMLLPNALALNHTPPSERRVLVEFRLRIGDKAVCSGLRVLAIGTASPRTVSCLRCICVRGSMANGLTNFSVSLTHPSGCASPHITLRITSTTLAYSPALFNTFSCSY